MEKLVIDGREYVKASKAAKSLGYTSDYIGQLCRSKQVSAHLVGRTWYVHLDELSSHKVTKKRMSRVKAREQAKKSIQEHKDNNKDKTRNIYRNIDIQYETDESELIPETRKLTIQTQPLKRSKVTANSEKGGNTIENKGLKVLMAGDLSVVDVTDESIDSDTVILTPKLNSDHDEIKPPKHTKKEETESQERHITVKSTKNGEIDPVITRDKLSFEDRLMEDSDVEELHFETPTSDEIEDSSSVQGPIITHSLIFPVATILLVCVLSLMSVFLHKSLVFSNNPNLKSATTYSISIQDTLHLIRSKL